MEINDIIRFVFDGATGPFILFDNDSDQEVELTHESDLDSASDMMMTPSLDLITDPSGDTVAGLVFKDIDAPMASMVLTGPNGSTLSIFLLDEFAPASAGEALGAGFSFPLPYNLWQITSQNEDLFTLDEITVFLNSEEQPDVESIQEEAVEDRGGEGPSGVADAATDEGDRDDDGDGEPAGEGPGDGEDLLDRGLEVPAEEGTTHVETDSVEAAEPAEYLNDAEVIGEHTSEMEDLLDTNFTFLTGQLWGQFDKRNTQDGKWKATTMPLRTWIDGFPGDANTKPFGLSRHPESKFKAGDSIVLGDSLDGARKAKAMTTMYAMGLDIDSGSQLNDVVAKIEDLDLFALIYTSHSHGKSGMELKRDEVLRKLEHPGPLTDEDVRIYLKEHSKDRFEDDFILNIKIAEEKKQTKEGVKVILNTPPLDKFRVIFPLMEPVNIIDLAERHDDALSMWEDKITGLAVNNLGVHFDTTCTDPSRLFYTARHPKGAAWDCVMIQGMPLKFEDVQTYPKQLYARQRAALDNAFAMAGADQEVGRAPQVLFPSGNDANAWHRMAKSRFMLADVIEQFVPDKMRNQGGEAMGTVHVECPFEHLHSKDGGTGTMAMNCDANESDVWTIFCHHDSCQGRHKLEFLSEMIREQWFPEETINDDEYLLPPPDDELDDVIAVEKEVEKKVQAEAKAEAAATGEEYVEPEATTPAQEAALKFDMNSDDAEILKFLKKQIRKDLADRAERSRINNVMVKITPLNKTDMNKLWKEADKDEAKRREANDPEAATKPPLVNEAHFHDIVRYAEDRIDKVNAEEPRLFHYMENLSVIRMDAKSHARIKFLNEAGFANVLNKCANFEKSVGEGGNRIGVSAPLDVVKHMFADDYGVYPPLRGLVTSPTYSRSGQLINMPGYHIESNLYYQPAHNLMVKKVTEKPTDDEVTKAKMLLIDEVFSDFPLGGLTRAEIVDQGVHGDGIPAVANLIALTLLPFMREMVDGPTPGHLLTKPAPGTGASLLTDVISIITTGVPTPAMAMPGNKDEMSKTLTSVLANGQNIVFFDNINHTVDSGELASAMTTPTYSARILGKSQTVEAEVRCVWILTGNNVTLSSELVRRLVMIDLDAKMANPEIGRDFKHKDIRGWVTKNRGELVWACLTLIQNWIAKGKNLDKENVLASYENWSGMVGGVLQACGLGGFMGNREELREKSDDDDGDEFISLLNYWWSKRKSKGIPVRDSDDGAISVLSLALEAGIELPMRKQMDSDGELSYPPKAVGKLLGSYRDRVFRLENGMDVILTQGPRSSKGKTWLLVAAAHSAPEPDVSDDDTVEDDAE